MDKIEYGMGCKKSPIDLRDFRINSKKAKAVVYPDSFMLNKGTIKNQGSVCSCVGHSMSEILEFHDNYKNKLSTNFIYGIHNKLYGSTGPGMTLREACKIAYEYGDMLLVDCPGNTEVDKVYDLANSAFENSDKLERAKQFKIKKYARAYTEDDLKFALVNYGPVLVSVKWYKNYIFDANGVIKFDETSEWGRHAVVLIGWDEYGWIIKNSWGASWGNKGLFKLPIDYKFNEAYSIVDDESDGAIVNPTHNSDALILIYKLVNCIINLFIRR